MKLVRNLAAAFSLYSKIPMPYFNWKEEDMRYSLVFLPWVGAVVGAVVTLVAALLIKIEASAVCCAFLVSSIPLLITGGFHYDGFLDYQDATKSYKSRKEKLVILKDPHIGAFAGVGLLTFITLWGGGLILLFEQSKDLWGVMCFASFFAIVRAIAGALALNLRQARKKGMLAMEAKSAARNSTVTLCVEIALGLCVAGYCDPKATVMACIALANFALYYRFKCYRELGGVTGDTTGYFIVQGETVSLLAIALTKAFL